MREEVKLINGVPLFYREKGDGPCVVLLHGFGETGSVWEAQFEALSQYRLLVPDLPGSGRSGMIADRSMDGLAEAIYQLLLALDVKKCVLIGHSMGGYVALAFWEKHPEMLAGVGLFHSTAYADSDEKKATRQKGIQFIEQNGAWKFLQTTTPNMYSPASRENNPGLIESHLQTVKEASAATLTAYYLSMMERPDRSALLQQNKIPVLFVIGKHDAAVPPEDALKQAHLPALAHVHLLESSGHMGMREEPEKSNQLLQQFLSSVRL